MRAFIGFAGFGGVEIALRESGIETIGIEKDPTIAEVNRRNGGTVITADILGVDPGYFTDCFLTHFSPPCTKLSVARNSKAKQDIVSRISDLAYYQKIVNGEDEWDIRFAQKICEFIMRNQITRPLLCYHGGKYRLAPWIIDHFPPHRIYTETFGGAASVLLRKPRSYAEIYNDLDGEIVNVFRVVRDPTQGRELIRLLTLTPYSRSEFDAAYLPSGDPIEQARRTITKSFMGFSGIGITGRWKTGFRANSKKAGTTPAHDWTNYPEALELLINRLRGVVIENRPAEEIMISHDSLETLHYIDPPYPIETRHPRWAGNAYRYEMTDNNHRDLAGVLHDLRGMVVISGYPCSLYDIELYSGWQRIERSARADGAAKRIEVLWLSPSASKFTAKQKQLELWR